MIKDLANSWENTENAFLVTHGRHLGAGIGSRLCAHSSFHVLNIAGMVTFAPSSHSASTALLSPLECQRNVHTKNHALTVIFSSSLILLWVPGKCPVKKMGGGGEEGEFWAEEAPLLSVGGVGMQGPGSEQKGKAGQQEWGGH